MPDQQPDPLEYASPSTARPRKDWGRTLLRALILAVICILLIVMVWPAVSRNPSPRVACQSNLRQLGIAVLNYANLHQGAYPDSLETLILAGNIRDETIFQCPHTHDLQPGSQTPQVLAQQLATLGRPDTYATATTRPTMYLSYIYCGNGVVNPKNPSKVVIAYEPLCNHDGKVSNFLFADCHVEIQPSANALRLIQSLGTAPPPPATAPDR